MADSARARLPLSRYNAKRDFRSPPSRHLKGGAQWTITTAREYVSFEKTDPWQGYWAKRQTLDYAMEALGYKAEKLPSGRPPRRSSPERGSHSRGQKPH
jgi:hypothetical protein